MTEPLRIKTVAYMFLGNEVRHSGRTGTVASIDMDGHIVIEFGDGTSDCVHYSAVPIIANAGGVMYPHLLTLSIHSK